MNDFRHPLGNFKISFLKTLSKIINYFSINFLSLLFKIDKNKSELIISSSFHAPWKEDKDFFKFYTEIKNYTLLDTKRLYTLWQMSNFLQNYKGDILDIGCLKGGAGMTMSKKNKKGTTFLIDTFTGLVESENFHKRGHFVFKNIENIKEKVKVLNLKNTKVIKGTFPKDFRKKFKNKKLKLCHLDVNTLKSTSESFKFIKNKIVRNGVIIFDDYGIYSVFGVKKFVDKIARTEKKNFIFINNYMGQCILIKK